MKRKIWIVVAGLALVVLAGGYVASPLLAFQALGRAAETGDQDKLERLVDFPAVRANLKDQLSARLSGALQSDRVPSDSPLAALGALLGSTIVDQVVNLAVTPAGVAAIIRSGKAPLGDVEPDAAPPPPTEPAAPPAPGTKRTRFAYLDMNHFRATTVTSDAPDAPLGWVLERRGLMGWKLVSIELPPAP